MGKAYGLSLKIENCDAVRRTSLSLFVGIGGVVRTNPLAGTIGVTGWHKVPNPRALSVALELSKRFLLLTKVIYYRSVWLWVNTECGSNNRIYPIILLYLSVALGLSKRAGFLCHPIVFTLCGIFLDRYTLEPRLEVWSRERCLTQYLIILDMSYIKDACSFNLFKFTIIINQGLKRKRRLATPCLYFYRIISKSNQSWIKFWSKLVNAKCLLCFFD